METNKLTWEFLKHFNFKNPLPNFRSKATLDKYKTFKNNTKNVSKFIYEKYLKNKPYCIEKNDFPYVSESNMEHYILWINNSFSQNISKVFLENIIKNKMQELGFNEYIFFENHESVKTIHDILHYQIFFRKISM